jgi:UrcA family protein
MFAPFSASSFLSHSRLPLAALAAAALAASAGTAFAGEVPDARADMPHVAVKVADLDLHSAQGRETAERRLRMAARDVCGMRADKTTLTEAQQRQTVSWRRSSRAKASWPWRISRFSPPLSRPPAQAGVSPMRPCPVFHASAR